MSSNPCKTFPREAVRTGWLSLALIVATIQTAGAYHSGGHRYELTCNASGYVLTSKYPVVRTIGHGAGTREVEKIEMLYLGRSCDASHEIFGTGKWCWANGGFIAEFTDYRFGFGRQELSCPATRSPTEQECRC